MDILVVHPSLNARGGSERVCLTIIEGLRERGYNVTLGTFEKTNWKSVKEFFGEVTKPDIEFIHSRCFGASAYGELLNFHTLLSHLLSKKYETIIISCTSPWFYCPIAEKTIVYMIPPVNYRYGLRRAYLTPYILIQSMLLKRVKNKIILTNSSFSSRVIKNVYGLNSKVIYPPVDIEKFPSSSNKEDLVISIGRFNPFKRYEILIRAFSKVNKGKCIIIGSIYDNVALRYLRKLKRLIEDLKLSKRVKLVINCPVDTLRQILSKAKLYVHCTFFEHFGISIVEAMACGCVPIVHRSGGPYTDIVRYGEYGFIFRNSCELADLVNLLLKDNKLYKKFSQKAVRRSKVFDKENFKKKFLMLL